MHSQAKNALRAPEIHIKELQGDCTRQGYDFMILRSPDSRRAAGQEPFQPFLPHKLKNQGLTSILWIGCRAAAACGVPMRSATTKMAPEAEFLGSECSAASGLRGTASKDI